MRRVRRHIGLARWQHPSLSPAFKDTPAQSWTLLTSQKMLYRDLCVWAHVAHTWQSCASRFPLYSLQRVSPTRSLTQLQTAAGGCKGPIWPRGVDVGKGWVGVTLEKPHALSEPGLHLDVVTWDPDSLWSRVSADPQSPPPFTFQAFMFVLASHLMATPHCHLLPCGSQSAA